MRKKIIVVGSQKGGVGKSTTASAMTYSLSKKLSKPENKVCLIDLDEIGVTSDLVDRTTLKDCEIASNRDLKRQIIDFCDKGANSDIENSLFPLRENIIALLNLDPTASVITTNKSIARQKEEERDKILARILLPLIYDDTIEYIVFDTAGGLNAININVWTFGLMAQASELADMFLLVPCEPNNKSLEASMETIHDFKELASIKYGLDDKDIHFGTFFNKAKSSKEVNYLTQVNEIAEELYGDNFINVRIPNRQAIIDNAQVKYLFLDEMYKSKPVAKEFDKIRDNILAKLDNE